MREIDRVLTADGRLVISAWIPQGPIMEMNAAAADAVRQALGLAPGPQPFAWHDGEALRALLAPYGFTLETQQHSLEFTASSPQDYLDGESRNHPMAVAGLGLLAQVGQAEAVRTRLLQILEAGNEDPSSFRATSRYIVATRAAAPPLARSGRRARPTCSSTHPRASLMSRSGSAASRAASGRASTGTSWRLPTPPSAGPRAHPLRRDEQDMRQQPRHGPSRSASSVVTIALVLHTDPLRPVRSLGQSQRGVGPA